MSPMLRAILEALFGYERQRSGGRREEQTPARGQEHPDALEEARQRLREGGQRNERLLREGAIAAGGAGTASRLRRAEYEASRGPGRPSPVDARAAVEKWLRAGGPKPSTLQFAAAGVSEEEAEAKRATKIAARRQRQSTGMRRMALDDAAHQSSSTAVVRLPNGQYQAVTQVGDEPTERSGPTSKEEAERIAEAARRRAMMQPLGIAGRMAAMRRALELGME